MEIVVGGQIPDVRAPIPRLEHTEKHIDRHLLVCV